VPRILAAAIVLLTWLAVLPTAFAQDYPSRPVKLIIPLGPGGAGDVFTRLLAEELQKRLGQPFVVENRPGGGLNIGSRACAEAPPDVHTLCVLSGETLVYNQFTFKSLPYSPEKDFEPIVGMFINANALVINASHGVKTIPELIAYAKAKPGTLSYGTFSFMLVYFMDKLNKDNGIDIIRVPFRSGNEMVNAVMTNTTPVVFLGLANTGPDQERAVQGACAQFQRALVDVPRYSDARRSDGHRLSAAMVRIVRSRRHARSDYGKDQRRGAAHHQRAGIPPEELHRPRGRARAGAARRLRALHRRRAQDRAADREGQRRAAQMSCDQVSGDPIGAVGR